MGIARQQGAAACAPRRSNCKGIARSSRSQRKKELKVRGRRREWTGIPAGSAAALLQSAPYVRPSLPSAKLRQGATDWPAGIRCHEPANRQNVRHGPWLAPQVQNLKFVRHLRYGTEVMVDPSNKGLDPVVCLLRQRSKNFGDGAIEIEGAH